MASRENAIKNNLNERARFYGLTDEANTLTIEKIRALMQFYDYSSCKSGTKPATSVDHVTPLVQGGQNKLSNLQLLTVDENKEKGDALVDYRQGNICPDDFMPQSTEQAEKSTWKYDWDALRFEYVTTELSLRELARKHKMDVSLVLKRAASERWVKERENFAINLLSDVKEEAKRKDVSSRVMILEAARIALEEWQNNDTKSDLAQLSKILELAARVEGLELNKQTLTVKDWRDVAGQNHTDPDELDTYFATLEGTTVSSVEDGPGAGWTD